MGDEGVAKSPWMSWYSAGQLRTGKRVYCLSEYRGIPKGAEVTPGVDGPCGPVYVRVVSTKARVTQDQGNFG